MARADEIWAQAWSEPDAGSDLAAIRARARWSEGAGGGWLLSGHEDLELTGGVRGPGVRPVPLRPRPRSGTGA